MFTSTDSNVHYTWEDYFNFIEFSPKLERKATVISKRKFLKNFSELENINELHILILKHIYELINIVYYPEDRNILLELSTFTTITVPAKHEDFYDFIQKSIKDEY